MIVSQREDNGIIQNKEKNSKFCCLNITCMKFKITYNGFQK